MAIAEGRTTTISADGPSDWIRLERAKNRLLISCASWSTSEVNVDFSDDATIAYKLGEDEIATLPIVDNFVCDLNGLNCFVRIQVAAYGGSPVTLKVINPLDRP